LVVSFWLLAAGLNHERRGGIGLDAQQQRKAHNPEEKARKNRNLFNSTNPGNETNANWWGYA
jgi:hypothetical protein